MTFNNLKNGLCMVALAMMASSCSKNDEAGVRNKKYSNSNGTYVILTTQNQWSVVKTTLGGSVHFNASGSTNADKITVTPNTSGVETDQTVTLNSDKSFNQDITVSTFSGSPSGQVGKTVTVNVYRGNDILTVNLNSGTLSY